MNNEPVECQHCKNNNKGKGRCNCYYCIEKDPLNRILENKGKYGETICTICRGTGTYYPKDHFTVDLSGIPSTVSSEDIENLRDYAGALKSLADLHRELIALKSVDRKLESEDTKKINQELDD